MVGLWGCSDATGPLGQGDPSIRTDRAVYTASHVSGDGAYRQYGFELIATFTNHEDRTVYLDRCYPDSTVPIFAVLGVGFDSAYNAAWACVGHDQQFTLEPGETRTDTLRIRGPNSWRGGTPRGELDGEFELAYFIRYCPGECRDRAPEHVGRSGRFTVRQR